MYCIYLYLYKKKKKEYMIWFTIDTRTKKKIIKLNLARNDDANKKKISIDSIGTWIPLVEIKIKLKKNHR